MYGEDLVRDLTERLEKLTIHEVRQVAREVKSHVTSGQKGQIIEAVLSLAKAEIEPAPLSNRGAPPKSDKYDEQLVRDILKCREHFLAEKYSGGQNRKTGVADVAAAYSEQSEKEYTGFLGADGANCFLFGEETVYVSDLFVKKYGLRTGDKIIGTGRKSNSADFAGLTCVKSVNGKSVTSLSDRKNYSSFTRIYPSERIVTGVKGDIACRMADLFTPLAFGQRALVFASANSGKTTLIKSIALGICAKYRDLKLICVMLGARPEEVTEFKRQFPFAEIFHTTFDMYEDRHELCASLAFGYAERLLELGENAIVIADGLYENLPFDKLKKYLYKACDTKEGASLTVIAALPEEACALANIANTAIYLSSSLAAARVFPSIDILKSYTGREEVYLNGEELSLSRGLRAKIAEGLPHKEVVKLFENTENNTQLINKIKNG